MDLGNTNFKEVGNQRSASALQDEVCTSQLITYYICASKVHFF